MRGVIAKGNILWNRIGEQIWTSQSQRLLSPPFACEKSAKPQPSGSYEM